MKSAPSAATSTTRRCNATSGNGQTPPGNPLRPIVADRPVVEGAAVDAALAAPLARDDVDYVHVRFGRTGCFACRVERA